MLAGKNGLPTQQTSWWKNKVKETILRLFQFRCHWMKNRFLHLDCPRHSCSFTNLSVNIGRSVDPNENL